MSKNKDLKRLKSIGDRKLSSSIEEVGKNETEGNGGAPKVYTDEYVNAIFNDFVKNNGDEEITADKLTKWCEKSVLRDKTIGKSKGVIPRYKWYEKKWKDKIEKFNGIPFALRVESIFEVGEFKIDQLCAKHGLSIKATKEFMQFEHRANIALDIAKKAEAETIELRQYKELYEKTKIELEAQKKKTTYYEGKYKSLLVTSPSKTVQVKNKLKGNLLTLEGKSIKEIEDEFDVENIIDEVEIKEPDLNSATDKEITTKDSYMLNEESSIDEKPTIKMSSKVLAFLNKDQNLKSPVKVNTDKKKLYILIGNVGAGKSTYAKEYLSDARIISSDEVRRKLTGSYEFSSKTNDDVFESVKDETEWALSKGFDIVIDSTNLHAEQRKDFIEIAKEYGYYIIAVVFKTLLSVCINRNATRSNDRKVPINTIIRMSEVDLDINKAEGFDEIFYRN